MLSDRYPILKFFEYAHLPERLQTISKPFGELAQSLADARPEGNPETAAALRKLLEAKDCAVRAALAILMAVMVAASLACGGNHGPKPPAAPTPTATATSTPVPAPEGAKTCDDCSKPLQSPSWYQQCSCSLCGKDCPQDCPAGTHVRAGSCWGVGRCLCDPDAPTATPTPAFDPRPAACLTCKLLPPGIARDIACSECGVTPPTATPTNIPTAVVTTAPSTPTGVPTVSQSPTAVGVPVPTMRSRRVDLLPADGCTLAGDHPSLASEYLGSLNAAQDEFRRTHPTLFAGKRLSKAITQTEYLDALAAILYRDGFDAARDGTEEVAIAARSTKLGQGFAEQMHPLTSSRDEQEGAFTARCEPKWFTVGVSSPAPTSTPVPVITSPPVATAIVSVPVSTTAPVVDFDPDCPCVNRVDVHVHGAPQNPMRNTPSGTGDGYYCIHMDVTARFGIDQCGGGGCIGKPDDRDHPTYGNQCEFQSRPNIVLVSGQIDPAKDIRFDPPDPLPYTFRLCGPTNTPVVIRALPPVPYVNKRGKAVSVCGIPSAPDGGTTFEGTF